MFTKRGVIEIQFHWIFILIVGAFLLTFFISLGLWYKGSSHQQLQGEVLAKLGSLLKTAEQSSSASKAHSLPEVELTFRCDLEGCNNYGCTSQIEIGTTGMTTPIDTDVIFAPQQITTNKLVTWTQSWDIPFKVTNVLYVTSPEYRYVVVKGGSGSSDDLATQLSTKLQESTHINAEIVDNIYITEVPNVHYRYIVFDSSQHNTLLNQEKDALLIEPSSGEGLNSGTVTFKDSSSPVPYIGVASLLGAVFSGTEDFYTCTMNKGLAKLRLQSAVYEGKAQQLNIFYTTSGNPKPNCAFYFNENTQTILQQLKSVQTMNDLQSSSMMSAVQTLKHLNERASLSCRELY